ncbi:MAG: hypothetical protein IJB94_06160 [Clostridia bacterium]|nr:hypothetical protein [Clostridia bacterium]
MAIWQLHFQLIPINGKKCDQNILLSDASTSILTSELPATVSWNEEDKLFGDLDATCVEIVFYHSAIDEISVRLDIRSLFQKQLNAIIEFARFNNLQILYNEKTIPATADNVCTMIRQCDALRFLKNPQQFLKELSETNQ